MRVCHWAFMTVVFAVANGTILALYSQRRHAEIHARTILGATVKELIVLNQLPPIILDDIASDDWDAESETPVQEPESDVTQTNPSTPRAKSKSTPP
jgi:hypothetical protein